MKTRSFIQINIYGVNLNQLKNNGVDFIHLLDEMGFSNCWVSEVPIFDAEVSNKSISEWNDARESETLIKNGYPRCSTPLSRYRDQSEFLHTFNGLSRIPSLSSNESESIAENETEADVREVVNDILDRVVANIERDTNFDAYPNYACGNHNLLSSNCCPDRPNRFEEQSKSILKRRATDVIIANPTSYKKPQFNSFSDRLHSDCYTNHENLNELQEGVLDDTKESVHIDSSRFSNANDSFIESFYSLCSTSFVSEHNDDFVQNIVNGNSNQTNNDQNQNDTELISNRGSSINRNVSKEEPHGNEIDPTIISSDGIQSGDEDEQGDLTSVIRCDYDYNEAYGSDMSFLEDEECGGEKDITTKKKVSFKDFNENIPNKKLMTTEEYQIAMERSFKIRCEFQGCGKIYNWRYRYGKLRLMDHALTHSSQNLIKCRLCLYETKNCRNIKLHYRRKHEIDKVVGYGMKDLLTKRINIYDMNRLWRACFKGSLNIVGEARTELKSITNFAPGMKLRTRKSY